MDEVNVCFSLPSINKDYSIRQFDFINNGQAILFSGHYNKEEGIFLYDISNDSVVKVVSGDFYNLSNDKTKILYDTITDGISNIYGAKINGNTVTSRKCIYNNIDTYAAISISSWWTPNDNTILIDEEDSSRSTEKRHFKLRLFDLKE
jgi:Tol biopolymer transport system component